MLWNLKQQGLYGDAGSGLPYAHRFNPAWSQMGGPGPNGGNPMAGGDGGGGDQQRAGYQSPGGPFGPYSPVMPGYGYPMPISPAQVPPIQGLPSKQKQEIPPVPPPTLRPVPPGLPGGVPNRFPLQGQPGQPNGGGQQRAWNPMQNPAMLNYLNRQPADPNFLNIIGAGIGEEDEYWRELKKKQGGWRWTTPPQPSWWL